MGRHEKRLGCGDEPWTPIVGAFRLFPPAMIDEKRTGSRYFRAADENRSLIRK